MKITETQAKVKITETPQYQAKAITYEDLIKRSIQSRQQATDFRMQAEVADVHAVRLERRALDLIWSMTGVPRDKKEVLPT